MSKINYRGRVTLWSENHSPVTIYNSGEVALFRLICDFLAGQRISSSRLPASIKGENVFSSCPIVSISAGTEDSPVLEVQASIPSYSIISVPSSGNVTIQLCDGIAGEQSILATTSILATDLQSLSSSSPMVFIKWELVFGNETSPNENNTEQGE